MEVTNEIENGIEERAETLFRERLHAHYARTDRLFVGLLLFQWLLGIMIVCWFSPLAWSGTTSTVHPHVWAALLLGGAILVYPLLLASTRPGSALTRHAIAIAQMLFSTLLIHLMGGRIEAHFHIFGSLAFLAFYRDWRVLLTASAVTAADHYLRGLLLPQSIFGVLVPGAWRWAEHTGWVVFEDVFLFISIAQSHKEIQDSAQRQAQLEATNAGVEATILARTAELQASRARLREAQQVAGLGSWERDLATDTIRWSEEMFRLYRFDPAEGTPSLERMITRIHPDDRVMYQRILAKSTQLGEHFAFDLRLLFEDGTLTWGHVMGHVEQDATGQAVRRFGTFMDVTAQKLMEIALRQSQESLNYAQALAHIGSWDFDLLTGQILWSAEMFHLLEFDVTQGAPTYDQLMTRYHPEDVPMVNAIVQQAIQDGLPYEFDARLVMNDGSLRWTYALGQAIRDASGQVVRLFGTVMDITERVRASQEQTKFACLIENSSDFIGMASLDGVLLTLNPAGRKLVGVERVEEVSTMMLPDLMPEAVWEWVQQGIFPIVMREGRWEGECQLVNVATGQVYDMQASFFLIHNPRSGEPMCLATVQRDITAQKWLDTQLQQSLVLMQDQNVELEWQQQELAAANAHLEALATTDGLTGAKNHRAFQEKLHEEFNRVERSHRPFSVILLDVDKFKQYNDSFGHPEGDQVLKQVVRVLQETARDTDFVARYGGEEFIILLLETGEEGAIEAAERFRAAIEEQNWPLRQVTASFGVATLSLTIETGSQLVDKADKALYASKAAGRNRVTHARELPGSLQLA